jgi:hypothetical protein
MPKFVSDNAPCFVVIALVVGGILFTMLVHWCSVRHVHQLRQRAQSLGDVRGMSSDTVCNVLGPPTRRLAEPGGDLYLTWVAEGTWDSGSANGYSGYAITLAFRNDQCLGVVDEESREM